MNKVVERSRALLRELLLSVWNFPLEFLLALAYYVVTICLLERDVCNEDDALKFLMWFLPNFTLLFTLDKLRTRHVTFRVGYYASWFLWIPLLVWCDGEPGWNVGISYLLSLVALTIGSCRMDNAPYVLNVLRTVGNMAASLLPSGLLGLLYSLTIASINFLFGVDVSWKVVAYPNLFFFVVVLPLVFCTFDTQQESGQQATSFLGNLVNRVLTPALVVYTVILYSYGLKILLQWQLPKGGVAYMVTAFILVALVVYALRIACKSKAWDWFYANFSVIALPLLVLLWVGTVRRTAEYGLTEWRVYLILSSALTTLYVLMLLRDKTRDFQLMALIFGLTCAVFTYVPLFSAKTLSIASQIARLDKALPQLLQGDTIPADFDYKALAKDTARLQTVRNAHSAYTYLQRHMDKDEFQQTYGRLGAFNFHDWRVDTAANNEEEEQLTETTYTLSDPVSLGDYTTFIPNSERYYTRDSLSVTMRDAQSGSPIIVCNIMERLMEAQTDTTGAYPEERILTYRNDYYMVVIGRVHSLMREGARADSLAGSHFFFYEPKLFKRSKEKDWEKEGRRRHRNIVEHQH